MKVIDLVNKKRNDEELPKKFKYDDNIFVYDNSTNDYIYEYGNISFFNDYCSPIYDFADCLATFNKEIEIIEEDKKIEKLVGKDRGISIDYSICDIVGKINELIEEIEKLKESK